MHIKQLTILSNTFPIINRFTIIYCNQFRNFVLKILSQKFSKGTLSITNYFSSDRFLILMENKSKFNRTIKMCTRSWYWSLKLICIFNRISHKKSFDYYFAKIEIATQYASLNSWLCCFSFSFTSPTFFLYLRFSFSTIINTTRKRQALEQQQKHRMLCKKYA